MKRFTPIVLLVALVALAMAAPAQAGVARILNQDGAPTADAVGDLVAATNWAVTAVPATDADLAMVGEAQIYEGTVLVVKHAALCGGVVLHGVTRDHEGRLVQAAWANQILVDELLRVVQNLGLLVKADSR